MSHYWNSVKPLKQYKNDKVHKSETQEIRGTNEHWQIKSGWTRNIEIISEQLFDFLHNQKLRNKICTLYGHTEFLVVILELFCLLICT